MLWTPSKGNLLVQHNVGAVGTLTPGTSVTTGGSSSTKGTPVELISSTSFDVFLVVIMATNYGVTGTACEGAMDLLLGSATEDVIIANMLFGHAGRAGAPVLGPKVWAFPLYIPAGVRLAVQAAGARTSTAFRVLIFLYGGQGYPPFPVAGKVDTLGMGTVPRGTSITPGTSGAEGSWTQIIASTADDYIGLVPSFQVATDTTISNSSYAYDIGIGSAPEQQIAESFLFFTEQTETMAGPFNPFPFIGAIPTGSRLSVRVSNSNAGNDAGYDTVLHALRA